MPLAAKDVIGSDSKASLRMLAHGLLIAWAALGTNICAYLFRPKNIITRMNSLPHGSMKEPGLILSLLFRDVNIALL